MNNDTPSHEKEFAELLACVLIPTYNNGFSLENVINSVSLYTEQIIIINDGSTDHTEEILKKFPAFKIYSYATNRGKGYALRMGFKVALELGYQYAITLDSDGQHYASDLPHLLDAMRNKPESLIIGARNMEQEHIPVKSSFGNKFSSFWFWVETGIKLPDTQSGYRVYPLEVFRDMYFFSKKYEFEIEAPVRAAWKGVAVTSVPVQVYYPPEEERVSHFRPFKDFFRISVLNTFLTLIAITWIHPRNFVRNIRRGEGRKRLWNEIFVHPGETNQKKSLSIAFGIFMGILPVWGFQLLIGIPLSIIFRLNKVLFLLAANISIFPLTPIFWMLSLWVGKLILGYDQLIFNMNEMSLEKFKSVGIAFFLGGTVLAVVSGIIAYLLSLTTLTIFRKKNLEH